MILGTGPKVGFRGRKGFEGRGVFRGRSWIGAGKGLALHEPGG